MPTYVYECSRCEDVFEVEQRISESPLDACHCGAKGTVKRVIQPVGVMFKGAGFHINDYAAASAPETCTGEPSTCACSTPPATDE